MTSTESPEQVPVAAMSPRLSDLQVLVEHELEKLWPANSEGPLAPLADAIRYSLLAPGKRIRPLLLLAAAESAGTDPTRHVPAAAAFELVHTYSLVHDDLPAMDDDDLRRGRATSHRMFGEGVAVLVGDALQAEAYRLLAAAPQLETWQRLEIVDLLARAVGWRGMVGGQYLDIAAERRSDDPAALRDMHERKTGALLAACVEAGAVAGAVRSPERALFARFGTELGWLFQLVDDLLDEVGEQGVTGKAGGSDRRLEKVTAVEVFGIDGTREAADQQLQLCLSHAQDLPRQGELLAEIARFVHGRARY